MTEKEIARVVVDSAFQVHTRLGPGLLESVYASGLTHARSRSPDLNSLRLCGFA
jgi:hypothetical protein